MLLGTRRAQFQPLLKILLLPKADVYASLLALTLKVVHCTRP